LEGCCSRCLKDFTFTLHKNFDFVLSPDAARSDRKIAELSREDLGLSTYSTEEINLTPLIREQVMLAYPTHVRLQAKIRGWQSFEH
jgi:uncharacterized metal-binding protein YceD (DUF177 family)